MNKVHYEISHFEVSAKTGEGVKDAFKELIKQAIENGDRQQEAMKHLMLDEEQEKIDKAFGLEGVNLKKIKQEEEEKNNGGCACYYS
mmetsp:Transcript_14191/g.10242  ORF Transcript_14191/g.10242 Transcript_14191/m.10242 type:complete len:87 (+) Transcript_14191:541-801(+)|eukprot:CAMPEP_0202964116 /NCGR_PEP_ID=MMETSP1396-20130829/8193_1 /ASSEMBLY_ACC=CAM_ASM_000872 /TAXON_ID= /ORGANISM="Pseudokeronopsis sp., Strain Brazil" /LENGTH=86 /DNA_ID=CAMNT_0049685963 /DNA_START=494 /DNA_END=754 /DNA_ORIENTATION=+